MQNFNIYLAGGMGKFGKEDFDKSNKWRICVKKMLENCDSLYKVKTSNPNDYYSFRDNPRKFKSEKEIMEFDLDKVRHSDLIICNFNDKYSLGTMSELAIAYEHRIPIVGLNVGKMELHPWQREFCMRICTDMEELFWYVQDYFLN